MVSGDFNGDGKTDLALLRYDIASANYVTTLLNKGDGTFTQSAQSLVFDQGAVGGDLVPGSMVVGDFNGDGKMDLAVVGDSVNTGGVTVVLGRGDGTLAVAGPNTAPLQGFNLVATGDFNGDGILDLIASTYFDPGGTTILLGVGDGTFTVVANQLSTDRFASSLLVGDFNGDGKLDIAIGYSSGVGIYLGAGDGTFNQVSGSPFTGTGVSLVAGDFNHDGLLDLVGVNQYGLQLDLLLGVGDGTFTPTAPVPVPGQGSSSPFFLAAADFNQDGVPDLELLSNNQGTATALLSEPTETATATIHGIAPVGAGIHNVVASYPGDSNYSPAASASVALTAGLAPVVISPAGGTYSSVQTVTLTEAIPGATIFYYAQGAINTGGYVPYTGPISAGLGGKITINAYATETGYQQTGLVSATFTLNLPTAPAPVITPASGSYSGPQTVTIVDAAPNATVYYTVDGSVPTTASPVYKGPITVSASAVVSAIVTASGYATSGIASSQYFIASSQSSFIYTVAGSQNPGYSGDGGPATVASLNDPYASLSDSAGNLYIADTGNNVVRRVDGQTGIITTVAGTGIGGYGGDGGPATSAQLWNPSGLALDGAGNLYIADRRNLLVRKLALGTGLITTVAGSTTATSLGDNGPATTALLTGPVGLALDSAGNLYLADVYRVRKVTAMTGTITTVAGGGGGTTNGDGGPALSASLGYATGVALDPANNLYIADAGNSVVRKVTAATGIITTVAGSPQSSPYNSPVSFSGDGGPATSAHLSEPYAIAIDASGNLYIADEYNGAIREVFVSSGIITTVAGIPPKLCSSVGGDGGSSVNAALCDATGVSLDGAGNILIADSATNRIRKALKSAAPPTSTTTSPIFSVPGGTYAAAQKVSVTDTTPGATVYLTVNGGPATTAGQGYFGPISVTGSGTLQAVAVAPAYLPSAPVSATYTIASQPTAVMSTVAGTGVYRGSGTGGPATSANLTEVTDVSFDSAGNLYLADPRNSVVWKVAANTGTISVAAGTLGYGASYGGDGGLATQTSLINPAHVTVDSGDNLYIADTSASAIRKVAAQTGLISTYAGGGNYNSTLGDGQPATLAYLSEPEGMTIDPAGNLYIADLGNNRIRKVTASTGIITTVAGGSNPGGPLGDGGKAVGATLFNPFDVKADAVGNLYIADLDNGRTRFVNQSTGIITTVAGNGNFGRSGDGGPAKSAELAPYGLALDKAGNLYISNYPDVVRMVSSGSGVITTVAGTGYTGFGGDGGSATMANLNQPAGLAFDKSGSLYIADQLNDRVRKVTFSAAVPVAATPTFSLPAGSYVGSQTVSIADATTASTIYYTTDGSSPTTASSFYSGPITVSASETIRAVAVAAGFTQSSSGSAAYVISVPVTPTISLQTSQDPSLVANPIAFSVKVAAATGTPSGSISFLDGTTQLGSAALSAGATTYTISTLAAGSHSVSAVYSGDQMFSAATSASLVQVVTSTAIGIANGGSSSATVSAGGQATYALVLVPPSTGPALSLTVSGLPTGATATFSPATIPAGSAATIVSLTVGVPSTSVAQGEKRTAFLTLPSTLLALVLLPFSRRMRKTAQRWLWLVVLAILGAGISGGLSGCAGGASTPQTTMTPTPHIYTLTITATSGSFSQSSNLILTVNQ